jgi:hypothetical protein
MAARNRIVKVLREHSNAAVLFGLLMPCGDGTGEGFDLEMAAAWLIWKAKRRPPSEVVANFAYFLDHHKVEGLKVELLHGLLITTSIDLGASLRLEPFPGCHPAGRQTGLLKGANSNIPTTLADWAIRLLSRYGFQS